MKRVILPLLMVLGAVPVRAAPDLLCETADPKAAELASIAKAVFPARARSKADTCFDPLQLLRYGDADVLLTKRGSGDACHGCGARLSAFVLQRTPGAPKVLARFVDFAEIGSFGQAGDIATTQIDGHDAVGISGGGTFQGYTGETVSFFVFRDGRLDEIKPSLPLNADNSGFAGEEESTSVDGAWRVEQGPPSTVTVDYLVKVRGKPHRTRATWQADGNAFRLVKGKVPEEYAAASGN